MSEVSGANLFTVIVGGAFTVVTAAITGMIAFFGGKGSAAAQMQNSLNEGFRALSTAMQAEHNECLARVKKLESELAGLRQHVASLEGILRDNGIQVPRAPLVAPIFILDSDGTNDRH